MNAIFITTIIALNLFLALKVLAAYLRYKEGKYRGQVIRKFNYGAEIGHPLTREQAEAQAVSEKDKWVIYWEYELPHKLVEYFVYNAIIILPYLFITGKISGIVG